MVEEYADKFEKAIKKGFSSILILSILENGPSYGYKIGKEIEELTYSTWEPPASTMYTLLKQLSDQGLIMTREIDSDDRGKKIYEITVRGCETLKLMRKKQLKIRNALQSFFISTLGENESVIFSDFSEKSPNQPNDHLKTGRLLPNPFEGPFAMAFYKDNNLTDIEKLEYLKQKKVPLLFIQKGIKEKIKQFERAISKYENKVKGDIIKDE